MIKIDLRKDVPKSLRAVLRVGLQLMTHRMPNQKEFLLAPSTEVNFPDAETGTQFQHLETMGD
jgi:hypothetical protein